MANTAEVINFPVPDVAHKEPRVADLDDGFTRIANEILEAVMHAGLSQHQLLVFMAVMRKTYGFNKKSDWVSNEQLSELTGILPHKCSSAKSALVKRGILTQTGRVIGINKTVSEWSSLPVKGTEKKPYLEKVNLPESGKKSLPESGKKSLPESGKKSLPESGNGYYPNQVNTKDTITKDSKDNSNKPPKPPRAVSFDASSVQLPDWLSSIIWSSWVEYRRDLKKADQVSADRDAGYQPA
ncbi:replication protein O [Salmonella enterica subsp. enterica]|uniref:Replication protein O n=1 Tax=Salmonella enterica I TaxID=59201 RepID=A0A447N5W8_SALET|nr:replication protein O [Salmonella enterica subsp. enterica]